MAEAVETANVSFAANGGTGMGYLARPSSGTHPGVVVIQEWWGLEDHIKDVVNRFAQQGFVALAPDLYHGQVTAEPDEARKLAMELVRDQAMKEMEGAIDYLLSRDDVQPKRAGVIGFCMGGGLALALACRSSKVGAVADFYGGGRDDLDMVKGLSGPLFGAFGEADSGIPLERIDALRSSLAAHGKEFEVIVYPGAPHAFFNDTRPSYRAEAASDAWQRSLELFRRALYAAPV